MEEQNKYYIPTIEELCEGFEYESREYDEDLDEFTDMWPPTGFDSRSGLGHDETCKFNEGQVRVKYLDKEDIESLGLTGFKEMDQQWRSPLDKRPVFYWAEIKNAILGFDFVNHVVWVTVKDPCLDITGTKDEFDYPPAVGMFRGYIKNKSEFKTLLKQIHIL